MARWRSGNAQVLHDLIARFDSGPGLQFVRIGASDQSLKRLTRLERMVVAIQFVVVATFMMTAVAGPWLL